MKNIRVTVSALVIATVLLSSVVFAGCVSNVEGTEIDDNKNTVETKVFSLESSEDILNLVTDDDKLVINYYDAYIWVVFFGESGNVEDMIYIYKFESEDVAKSMVKTRREELAKNKTMKITDAYSVGCYVVVELEDSSFSTVTREMLENNFSQLIVI